LRSRLLLASPRWVPAYLYDACGGQGLECVHLGGGGVQLDRERAGREAARCSMKAACCRLATTPTQIPCDNDDSRVFRCCCGLVDDHWARPSAVIIHHASLRGGAYPLPVCVADEAGGSAAHAAVPVTAVLLSPTLHRLPPFQLTRRPPMRTSINFRTTHLSHAGPRHQDGRANDAAAGGIGPVRAIDAQHPNHLQRHQPHGASVKCALHVQLRAMPATARLRVSNLAGRHHHKQHVTAYCLAAVCSIGCCVLHWLLCAPLAAVCSIGCCVLHWLLCAPLVAVCSIG
jgi:hypothetical protein